KPEVLKKVDFLKLRAGILPQSLQNLARRSVVHQMQTYFLGFIILLIALIVALIIIMVLRDQRELKTKQIAADLSQLEEVVGDLKKIKDELAPALASFK